MRIRYTPQFALYVFPVFKFIFSRSYAFFVPPGSGERPFGIAPTFTRLVYYSKKWCAMSDSLAHDGMQIMRFRQR